MTYVRRNGHRSKPSLFLMMLFMLSKKRLTCYTYVPASVQPVGVSDRPEHVCKLLKSTVFLSYFWGWENHQITRRGLFDDLSGSALGGAEGSVRLLLTKNPTYSFTCPLPGDVSDIQSKN